MFEPLTPETSGLKRLRQRAREQEDSFLSPFNQPKARTTRSPLTPLTAINPSSAHTPRTEINWTLSTQKNSKRFMEQASTVTQWKLALKNTSTTSLPLADIQTFFKNSEIKKGSLFIKGVNNSVPAARIFSSGTLTCASCSHLLNVNRGNEIIARLLSAGFEIQPIYKGDCASTYNGHFFIKAIKSEKKKRKSISGTNIINLSSLQLLLLRRTSLLCSYNAELQNCLVVSLPNNLKIEWSKKNHYQFSDSFHETAKTLLLVNLRLFKDKVFYLSSKLNAVQLNEYYKCTVDATLLLIKSLAAAQQNYQMTQGEFGKQGTLRIYNTGSVTALGVKNCELLQHIVEGIDKLIKENINDLQ